MALVERIDADERARRFPKTNLVIQFSPEVRLEAVIWFLEKIDKKGLWIRCEPPKEQKRRGLILHLTADKEKFLRSAERFGIRKAVTRGRLRSFTLETMDEFLQNGVDTNTLLTSAEKQFIVLRELEEIQCDASDVSVPGYPLIPLMVSKSVFQIYLQNFLILDYFPLHDESELNEFADDWIYSKFKRQPFDKIRQYFGDGIGLYFTFLEYCTLVLVTPAIFGCCQLLFASTEKGTIFYCFVNLFSSVILGQDIWRRKCENLSQSWGTFSEWRFTRPNYNATKEEWSNTRVWVKANMVSLGAVFLVVLVTATLVFFSLQFQDYVAENFIVLNLWQLTETVIIYSVGYYYRNFATFLTEWENHRTEADFEYYRVRKMVIFESVHNFLPLFYLTFWLQDLKLLSQRINSMLLIIPISSRITEIAFPLLFRKRFLALREVMLRKWPWAFCWLFCDPTPLELHDVNLGQLNHSNENWSPESLRIRCLEETDPRVSASRLQKDTSLYKETFDDYLEMYIQFGYIFLFASVSPYAAILGIINNFFEIQADAFKLCKVFRRPFAKRMHDIGPWMTAFQFIGVVAIMSNCAMLSFSNFDFDHPPITSRTAIFGATFLLAGKYSLYFFPDHHISRVNH